MQAEQLHFNIYGVDLTRLARGLVLDGEWEKAVGLLKEGLIGFTYDQAYDVLSGKQKLTGDALSGISLEPDHETDPVTREYVHNLEYQYGNLLYHKQKWYRIYAVVTNLGVCDFEYAGMPAYEPGIDKFRSGMARAAYYKRDRNHDIAFHVDAAPGVGIVLFEWVTNPPIWMTYRLRQLTPDIIFRRAGYRLEEFGASKDARTQERYERDRKTREAFEKEKRVDPPPPIEPVPPADIKTRQSLVEWECGWITPDGEFYGCNYEGHRDLAYDIFQQKYGLDPEKFDIQRSAEERNWLKFGTSVLTGDYCYTFGRVTQQQKDKMLDWCTIHKKPYPVAQMETTV